MRNKFLLAISLCFPLLMVGACTIGSKEASNETLMTEKGKSECDTQGLEALIGKSKDELNTVSLPANTRIIEPGTMVTKDYRVDRVNVDIDEAGIVTRIWCG